jgi:hypothetical protein
VPTIERSTHLLAGADSLVGLAAVASELGFAAPLPLDAKARNALGLGDEILTASVARGPGALRALLLDIAPQRDIHQLLRTLARELSRHTAQLLWIVLANDIETVVILCWSANRSGPRIVSLVSRRDRLFASDAETLSSLAASLNESDLLTYARWIDVLGRVSITRKFFRELQTIVGLLANTLPGGLCSSARRELALITVSRLIFLSFLETKGWLDGDFGFLENGFIRCVEDGGRYQRRVLDPLFFGTLNTPMRSRAPRARRFGRIPFLNGGLFSRSPLEKRVRRFSFTDEAFGTAFGSLLSRYRFTAHEDSADWSEASIDPEILGKAFEALMGSENRKGSGAFYTPQDIVGHLTDEALDAAMPGERSLESLRGMRVLDPACGSGAFLVHMLERLAKLRCGQGEAGSMAEIRRRVLASSIFGVDINPTAVWLCELRLWLSVVVETDESDPMRVVPLPNLDRHIRVGDSLAGGSFGDATAVSGKRFQSLRGRYMRATGPRKLSLARALDRGERDAATEALSRSALRLAGQRRELILARRSPDLFGQRHQPDPAERAHLVDLRRQLRAIAFRIRALKAGGALPFSFEAHFADAAGAGGFDIVIGNPPWVRLHRIPAASRQSLRRDFVVYREAAWRSGAMIAGAGRGFAAQVDMAALFVERSHRLAKPRGIVALLLPAKLWRSLAGGGVRKLLTEETEVLRLEDHGDSKSGFDAAVYPAVLVFRSARRLTTSMSPIRCEIRSRERTTKWESLPRALQLDDTPGSPWLLAPPDVRHSFECVRKRGVPLAESCFGRPLLGVKTGYNEAFIVHVQSVDQGIATISAGRRCSTIEAEMLRPALRGESLGSEREAIQEHIVWPHDSRGRVLKSLPPLTERWLDQYRSELARRTDLHSRREWWSVFRTESAANGTPRVIWADIGRRPRALVVDAGDSVVPLNTCYVIQCATLLDAHALASLINGPLIAAWLDLIAEPARGDYRRYLGWTMALMPVPAGWDAARVALATAGSTDAHRVDAALSAYALTRKEVEPLLSWNRRSG